MALFNEDVMRQRIIDQARWHLSSWGGVWDRNVDKVGVDKHKIAGKLCADTATRARQGGLLMAHIFTLAGVSQAPKCLTLSVEAEKMYGRKYTAEERNNIDIGSWCGIFALYIYKMAGLNKMPAWPFKVFGVSTEKGKPLEKSKCHLATTTKPQKGDIGIIGARRAKDKNGNVIPVGQNHHFIVTDVKGTSIESIDGNAGNLMEIVSDSRSLADILLTGGFYTPIWENCV